MRTIPNAVTTVAPEHVRLDDPALLLDPDASLMEFQRRVLDEARDARNPLLERVRFLSIVGYDRAPAGAGGASQELLLNRL